MEEFIFSKHAIEQMNRRNISMEIALEVLKNPKEIIEDNEQKIYQSIFTFTKDAKEYLVRIFVNTSKNPMVVFTLYRTSKINKYYES
jgi:hypothetical protein